MIPIGKLSHTNPNEYHCEVGNKNWTLSFGGVTIGTQKKIASRDDTIYDYEGQCVLPIVMEDGEKNLLSFGLVSYYINKS